MRVWERLRMMPTRFHLLSAVAIWLQKRVLFSQAEGAFPMQQSHITHRNVFSFAIISLLMWAKGNQSEVSGLHLLHRRHVLIYYLINQLWHKTPCCYIIELHLHSWFHFCCQVLPVRTICSNARFHPFLFESGKHPLGLFMQTTELNAP